MFSALFKTTKNYQNFVKARRIFLMLGITAFLSVFLFYSPTASIFSPRSSLFPLAVIGAVLGINIYVWGTTLSAFHFLPKEMLASHTNRPLFDDDGFSRQEEMRPYEYHDWHNDSTNPASPLYHAIHDVHRD